MLMTMRSHLFPFRTQKLSSFVPKILGGRLPGKIGRCRYLNMDDSYQDHPYIYSSIAQLAEHAAVNRRVVGSSPTWGAKEESKVKPFSLLFLCAAILLIFPFSFATKGETANDMNYSSFYLLFFACLYLSLAFL